MKAAKYRGRAAGIKVTKKLGQGTHGQVRHLVNANCVSLATQHQGKHQGSAKQHNHIVP